MNINELLERDPDELTSDETVQLLNYMIDALFNQSEHQKATIKQLEETIASHVDAITDLQLAMNELRQMFEVVKRASVELGGGYQESGSGIIYR